MFAFIFPSPLSLTLGYRNVSTQSRRNKGRELSELEKDKIKAFIIVRPKIIINPSLAVFFEA